MTRLSRFKASFIKYLHKLNSKHLVECVLPPSPRGDELRASANQIRNCRNQQAQIGVGHKSSLVAPRVIARWQEVKSRTPSGRGAQVALAPDTVEAAQAVGAEASNLEHRAVSATSAIHCAIHAGSIEGAIALHPLQPVGSGHC